MTEMFIEGMQYCATIIGVASGKFKPEVLEQYLPGFKQHGVDASVHPYRCLNNILTPSSVVTIDVYIDVVGRPKRFSPPPITRQTADAYRELIEKIKECGYAGIFEHRDGRTGLPKEAPLFEVVDAQ